VSSLGKAHTPADGLPLFLTQTVCERLRQLKAQPAHGPDSMLRLTVESGGCSGFQYEFRMVPRASVTADDFVFELDAQHVCVDDMSYDFVKGATLEFTQEMIKSAFAITNNPNVESGCGCGVSFSLKD
jgi:iron-sulfur cluster assembly accessory protein